MGVGGGKLKISASFFANTSQTLANESVLRNGHKHRGKILKKPNCPIEPGKNMLERLETLMKMCEKLEIKSKD